MTRDGGQLRGVEIRLLLPHPTIDDRRFDELIDGSAPRLRLAHYMLILLAATDVAIGEDEWTYFCLPQYRGPRRTAGADLSRQHKADLKRLCQAAGLSISDKPWRLEGDVTVDTRTLSALVQELSDALERRQPQALELFRRLRDSAPMLRKQEPHPKWPLGTLLHWVTEKVPQGTRAHEVEEFKRLAAEVTGVDRLRTAMRAAKCELPVRLFDWLLEERRVKEAEEVLRWIAPSFARDHGLERRYREAAERAGQPVALGSKRTWVGIDGGPARTALSGTTYVGPFDETAAGLGGAVSEDVLVEAANGVMSRLEGIVGHSECHIVVGCAGFDPDNPRPVLRALADARAHHRLQSDLWVGNDGDLLLFAPPLLGSGVAMVADVGSVVVGRGPGGQCVRRGGHEWLLADVGSAYEIAVSTLREILDRVDRHAFGWPLDDDTIALVRAARTTFGIPSPGMRDTGSWCVHVMRRVAREHGLRWNKSGIASFAHQVVRLAEDENAVASASVRASAESLGRHLADVLSWHQDASPRTAIVGFLPMDSEVYYEALIGAARKHLQRHGRSDAAEAKLVNVRKPATKASLDARVENSAGLFAELARMLSVTTRSELTPDEATVVDYLRDERTAIVEHIPRD